MTVHTADIWYFYQTKTEIIFSLKADYAAA